MLGKHELDELLAEREKLNLDIQKALDTQTDAWGIKVSNVEIKHVDLNESMVRAIARQAEAERERRAKVIHAEGELQASENCCRRRRCCRSSPRRCSCATCRRSRNIAGDKSSTIVFPVPMDDEAEQAEGHGREHRESRPSTADARSGNRTNTRAVTRISTPSITDLVAAAPT